MAKCADGCRDAQVQGQGYTQWGESMDMHIGVECGARGGSSHLLRRRDRREGVLLEPGADVGEQLDLLAGSLAHTLVAQPKLLAAAARRRRRRELQAVRGRQHCGRGGRKVAPADRNGTDKASFALGEFIVLSEEPKGATPRNRAQRTFSLGGQPRALLRRAAPRHIGQRGQGGKTDGAVSQTRWRSPSARSSMRTERKMPMTPWKPGAACFA